VEGWPTTIPFANLSSASSSLSQLELLLRKWEMGATYWKELTDEEFEELRQERNEQLESGAVMEPSCRTRSDKGKKRTRSAAANSEDSLRRSKKVKSAATVNDEDSEGGEEQVSGEQVGGEQVGGEQVGGEQVGGEQGGREQGGEEQGGEEQVSGEQGSREQAGEEPTHPTLQAQVGNNDPGTSKGTNPTMGMSAATQSLPGTMPVPELDFHNAFRNEAIWKELADQIMNFDGTSLPF